MNTLFEDIISKIQIVPLDVVLFVLFEKGNCAELCCDLYGTNETNFVLLVDQSVSSRVEFL